jgi:hypothetical protein
MSGEVFAEPEEITAAFLTEVIGRAGFDGEVLGLRHEPIGTGQIGRTFRLQLDLVGSGPQTLVAKMAGGDEAARSLIKGGYEKEVNFYNVFAHSVAVRIPTCWHAAITDELVDFTLMLDDLAPCIPGVQADGCTGPQAHDAVRNLAGLHAPTWNAPSLDEHMAWLGPVDEASSLFLGELMVGAVEQFIDRYQSPLGPEDIVTLREAAARTGQWKSRVAGPRSLLHGDYRLDNLLFPVSGKGVVAVDWQTVTVGPPTRDLGYFIATCLTPEDRRAAEDQLVDAYHEALVALGVQEFSRAECFDGYRLGVLQGPMITVLGCVYASAERSERADGMFVAMAKRACAALRDLGTFDLLAEAQ